MTKRISILSDIVRLQILMARQQTVNDNAEFLTYALIHLEKERDIVLAKIANIKQQLGIGKAPVGRPKKVAAPAEAAVVAAPEAAPKEKKTRVLSPAARKRISQAQKKRWAASREEK